MRVMLSSLTSRTALAGEPKITLAAISNGNGTSNTVLAGETLKGDSGMKALDMRRQHVAYKADALKGLKEGAGVEDWKADKHIAADRGGIQERAELEARVKEYTSPYRDVMRAKIVLLASEGLGNDSIAARLSMPRQIVSKWRRRFYTQRLLDEQPRGGRPAP